MMKLTDEEILTLIKIPEQKESAFRSLLINYQERLYFHVRRYVHCHEDANDILQNTFIKVWNGIENFRGDSALYTWLYRIAGNEAITFINKSRKRKETNIETTPPRLQSITDNMKADDMILKLQKAIDNLPDKQKQVFIMRYYDELPYDKMAEITETTVGALKASYHHAVKKIEEFLLA